MAVALFHSFFWEQQPAVPKIVLTAMSRVLGPPLLAIALIALGASNAW